MTTDNTGYRSPVLCYQDCLDNSAYLRFYRFPLSHIKSQEDSHRALLRHVSSPDFRPGPAPSPPQSIITNPELDMRLINFSETL